MSSVDEERTALITAADAERILEESRGDSQGETTIDGEKFEWWTDGRSCVWFYEPGNDGGNTIKRFETSGELYEVIR